MVPDGDGAADAAGAMANAAYAARATVAATDLAVDLALAEVDGVEEERKRSRALEVAELGAGRMKAAAAAAEAQEVASHARRAALRDLAAEVEAGQAELRRALLVLELRVAGSGGQVQLAYQGVRAARGVAFQVSEEGAEANGRLKIALDASSLAETFQLWFSETI